MKAAPKRYVVTCMGGAWLCTKAGYRRVLVALRDEGSVDLDRVKGCRHLGTIRRDVTDGLDDDHVKDELDRLRGEP